MPTVQEFSVNGSCIRPWFYIVGFPEAALHWSIPCLVWGPAKKTRWEGQIFLECQAPDAITHCSVGNSCDRGCINHSMYVPWPREWQVSSALIYRWCSGMVTYMCQLDWTTGCSGVGPNVVLDVFLRVFLDEISIQFSGLKWMVLPSVGRPCLIS